MIKSLLLMALSILLSACGDMSRDLNVKHLPGFEFSLQDIQEQCTVRRAGDQDIAVSCEEKRLRPVQRSCVGRMSGGLKDPKFYCSGGLWVLNDRCYIEMVSPKEGNIRCRKE